MKPTFRLLLPVMAFGLLFVTQACDDDDDINQSAVPNPVLASYAKMYPRAKGTQWERISGYYVADFTLEFNEMDAWFEPDGVWGMTETDFAPNSGSLPPAVYSAFINGPYQSWTIDDVSRFERPSDTFWLVEVETPGASDMALFYDTFGNLVNAIPDYGYEIYPFTDISGL